MTSDFKPSAMIMYRSFVLLALLLALAWGSRIYAADGGASFRVIPSRVILGSLAFGRSETSAVPIRLVVSGLPPGVQLTQIDCSHARGIRVIDQQCDKNGI